MQETYVCVELEGSMCAKWQVLQSPQSDLPLTREEAYVISVEICVILVITFGIVRARKMIEKG